MDVSKWIAYRLPDRVCYWVLIRMGVKYIRSNEIVPEVGFIEVLERASRGMVMK